MLQRRSAPAQSGLGIRAFTKEAHDVLETFPLSQWSQARGPAGIRGGATRVVSRERSDLQFASGLFAECQYPRRGILDYQHLTVHISSMAYGD
jgi:hypothetical protein